MLAHSLGERISYPVVRQVHGGDTWDVSEGVPVDGGEAGVDQMQFLEAVRKVLKLFLCHLQIFSRKRFKKCEGSKIK